MRKALLLVGSCMLLGACVKEPALSQAEWEALARERSNERWSALIEGRTETAYTFLSPAYREATPYPAYARTVRGFGVWKRAEAKTATCDEDRCIVTTELHLEIRRPGLHGPVSTVAYPEERWIIDQKNHNLWFVPNK